MSLQNFFISALIKYKQKANMKLSPDHRFKRSRKFMSLNTGKVVDTITVKTDTIGGVNVEWVMPNILAEKEDTNICIYFHGGAYISGGMNSHRDMAAYLAQKANLKMLMVDYRLAPEHPYPAAADDAMVVYQALLAKGVDSQRLIIGGDSAGGNLALATLQSLRDEQLPLPCASVLFSPWLDFSHNSESFKNNKHKDVILNKTILDEAVAMYAPGLPVNHEKISPLFGSVTHLPACLIIASKVEVLLDDARRLHEKIKCSGGDSEYVQWKNPPHAFPVLTRLLPEARQALDKTAQFMNGHLSKRC